MQQPLAVDDDRSAVQGQAAAVEGLTESVIGSTVADLQPGDATTQFAQLGEMPAERTPAIKDQHRRDGTQRCVGGRRIEADGVGSDD